jgi:uncharacterized glyoxalase superfamily protein PhnB
MVRITLACNVDSAEQVDTAFAAAVAAGATSVAEPVDRPWVAARRTLPTRRAIAGDRMGGECCV